MVDRLRVSGDPVLTEDGGGDVTLDVEAVDTERVSVTPQDLSALSLGADDDGDLYYHNGASAITVDGSSSSDEGYVRWDNGNSEWSAVEGGSGGSSPSYTTARKSTNQTWGGTGTFETVTWDSVGPSTLSGMDTTNNQFVPPADGDYKIIIRIGIETAGSGNTSMRIRDGGGNTIGTSEHGNGADATNVHEITTIESLTTADAVTAEALSDSAGDITGGSAKSSEFIVEQLA